MIFNRGNNFNLIASETRVNDPVISACEAITAAIVANMTPMTVKLAGIIWKNGFKFSIACVSGF